MVSLISKKIEKFWASSLMRKKKHFFYTMRDSKILKKNAKRKVENETNSFHVLYNSKLLCKIGYIRKTIKIVTKIFWVKKLSEHVVAFFNQSIPCIVENKNFFSSCTTCLKTWLEITCMTINIQMRMLGCN